MWASGLYAEVPVGGVSERVKVQGVFYDDVITLRARGTACGTSWQAVAHLAGCREPGLEPVVDMTTSRYYKYYTCYNSQYYRSTITY